MARAGSQLEVDLLHCHERAEMAAQRAGLEPDLGHVAARRAE